MRVIATQFIKAGEAVIVENGLARPAFTGERKATTALGSIPKGGLAEWNMQAQTIKPIKERRRE